MDNRLEELLKKKGIGPQGSKSLSQAEIEELPQLLQAQDISMTTKATMLTAMLCLNPEAEEKAFLQKLQMEYITLLPSELHPFISFDTQDPFRQIIHKTIRLRDLEAEEASLAMTCVLDPDIPEYLKAAFLEAQRLKRESELENQIFLSSLWQKAQRIQTDMPLIIDLCDNYDGINRSLYYTPFLAATLASLGYPTLLHGLEKVAPKMGITPYQLLKAAGKKTDMTLTEASHQLKEKGIAYIDQTQYFPELYALRQMRKEMVKRPFLATFEKTLQPIRATNGNLLMAGYVHQHFRSELIQQLAAQKKCAQAIVVKGIEGSTMPSLSRDTITIHYDGNKISEHSSSPTQYNIEITDQTLMKNISPEECLEAGIKALHGHENLIFKSILYHAGLLLSTFGLAEKESIISQTKHSLQSGIALKKWGEMS